METPRKVQAESMGNRAGKGGPGQVGKGHHLSVTHPSLPYSTNRYLLSNCHCTKPWEEYSKTDVVLALKQHAF